MKSPFRIVILGDSSRPIVGFNTEMLVTLLSHIKNLSPQPAFIVFVGDMVYGGKDVKNQLENWKALVEQYYPLNMFYTLLGSHENNEIEFSNAFPYLPSEQLSGYQRTVYYFDHEDARFIILNSNRRGYKGSYVIDPRQRTWLENTLEDSRKKYNFVFFHVPPFPTGHHYGESLDMSPKDRDALWQILDKYNVTAVFLGHEHNYCRRLIDKSFSSDNISVQNSIYQITTGGAGSSLNAHITDIKNAIVGPLAVHHYTILDISEKGVSLQVYDKDNVIIDSCSISPQIEGSNSASLIDIIISLNSQWKYLDDGSNQGTTWRELGYDDSNWSFGLAELGYGDGGEATVVSYGPNVHNKYITTYFRKQFTIDNASVYKSLIVRIQKDDGAVIYLNGTEIHRTNMPDGIINYDTLAVRALDYPEETDFEKIVIDAKLLRNGENVIAVEVHQVNSSSSDMSFNFQLLGDKSN